MRPDRQGQVHPVRSINLVAEDAVEERIHHLLNTLAALLETGRRQLKNAPFCGLFCFPLGELELASPGNLDESRRMATSGNPAVP